MKKIIFGALLLLLTMFLSYFVYGCCYTPKPAIKKVFESCCVCSIKCCYNRYTGEEIGCISPSQDQLREENE